MASQEEKKGGRTKLGMLNRHEIMPINFLQEVLEETFHFKFQACDVYSNLTHAFIAYSLLIGQRRLRKEEASIVETSQTEWKWK